MTHQKNIIIQGEHNKPILIDVCYSEKNTLKPVIIFCHGYKGFKDWGAWDIMAEEFSKAGFCLVKFNFSYNGGTIEQPIDFPDLEAFGNNNYSKELDDLNTVINWVCENAEIAKITDTNNISLLGHSRGGGIVTTKAEEDSRIKNVISLAGISSFKARFHEGTSEFASWKKTGVKYVENGRTKQQMPHYFQFYKDFIKNDKRLNIKRASENLKIPHLIIHGDQDTSILINEAEAIHQWSPKSKLKIIKGANHVFQTHHPWKEDTISQELQEAVEIIIDFIKA